MHVYSFQLTFSVVTGGAVRTVLSSQLVSGKSFGGSHTGDDVAHLLEPDRKPLRTLLKFGLREFDVRQWLFACQASLLFARGRALQVAEAGLVFVDDFTRILTSRASQLPSGLPHCWVLSACVALTEALSFSSVDLMVDQSGPPAVADAALLQVRVYTDSATSTFQRHAFSDEGPREESGGERFVKSGATHG
jgi:hypothetical protein